MKWEPPFLGLTVLGMFIACSPPKGKYYDEVYSSDEQTEAQSGKSLRSGRMGP